MRATTRFLALAAALAVAAPVAPSMAAGEASADMDDGGTFVPFAQVLRRCDFSESDWNGPTGYARPQAVIRSDGSTVSADVQIATAIPNIRYDVRLIQAPKPSSSPCWGGDPGVVLTHMQIDNIGNGRVTLQDSIEPGATGAWLFISRPSAFSQTPEEFYTTDFVAPI
ncbi:hypothetical protein [Mycobacterium sp. IDR2000157661]|uniref:hypothetical protein n=1 Tax=Mycobacterium sp. IDR2000157661 TaxID=2867005 RepID=UPI001EECF20E|nr:hypothetical protein [Mycobacterium sp. IDR2000157661]ULE32332.1 hypothetical protein K3G64_19690 [Mycobacterium sp. IDR2000157661]